MQQTRTRFAQHLRDGLILHRDHSCPRAACAFRAWPGSTDRSIAKPCACAIYAGCQEHGSAPRGACVVGQPGLEPGTGADPQWAAVIPWYPDIGTSARAKCTSRTDGIRFEGAVANEPPASGLAFIGISQKRLSRNTNARAVRNGFSRHPGLPFAAARSNGESHEIKAKPG